jgi:ABC-type polysaccharide/polyol phosphate export permease
VLTLITFAFALGLGLLVAATNVYFRDVEYLLIITLQVWFFLTPIIYQLDQIVRTAAAGGRLAVAFVWVLYANPMTWIVVSFQDVVAFHRWPTHTLGLLYATTVSLLAVGLGMLVFRRLSRRFAEEL